ncbi:MAG TPA: sulfite exporter TauE/SafE family protein [Gemmatimonadaceae bacterium]|nr:sulfite exporter TauE/SafE family protein [Gemmatimonadaceae bacterium]
MSLALAVLAASLLGSVHCAGMCGGFVCFYAGSTPGTPPGAVRRAGSGGAHAAYNLGRLASYALLGALAGALGGRLDALGRMAGVSRAAAILAGTLMVAWGLGRIAAAWGVRVPSLGGSGAVQRRLGAVLAAARERPPVARAALIGLLTTLLPCGWLYTFVVTAGGTGSALSGMLVMALFWAGTLPVMVAVGVGAQRLAGPLARRLPVVTAAALVVMGLLSISGKMSARPLAAHAAHGVPIAAPQHPHVAR